jgi:hypothetical protein
MRLIDADALLSAYDKTHEGPPGKARELIEEAPTVQMGYDEIINRVTNMVVTPPHGVTIVELKRWIEGHADAQVCVLSILNEMKDKYGM